MAAWWRDAVIYQVYPRSFQDSNGDGVGDLPGIASRLDHLEWLGVDALWLNPIYASPNVDYGYDVSDHTSVSPEYGTLDDLDELLAEVHRRGMRLVMDLVVSHTSIEHPWFRRHPDRYVWAEGTDPPNNWVASFGGSAWTRDESTGRLYLHSFYAEQPDLDWRNPSLRREMGEVVRFWADRGVDGFRVDAVDRMVKDLDLRDDPNGAAPFPLPVHPDQQHLDLVHSRDAPEIGVALEALREAAGELPLIGEVYLPSERARRYLDYFEAAFAFDLLHAAPASGAIAAAIERALGVGSPAWVTSNHDFSRVATRWGARNARAAVVLLLTLGGPTFVYQGEELGAQDGPGADPPLDRFGRDAFRHPMRWSRAANGGFSESSPWLHPPIERPGVDEQRGDAASQLELVRALIAFRRTMSGPPRKVSSSEGAVSFTRGEHLVVVNLGPDNAPLPGGGRLQVALESAPAVVAGEHLAPHSAAVFERV